MTDLEIYIQILLDWEFVFDLKDIQNDLIIYKYYSEKYDEYVYLYINYNVEYNYINKIYIFQEKEIFDKDIFLKNLNKEFKKRRLL